MQEKSGCETCKGCGGAQDKPQWKKDFPIEWEGDHYVSRREMVKFLTLGSSLLAAANWLVAWIWHMHREPTFEPRLIGSVAVLERDKSMLFRYPTEKDPCIAVCMPDGKLVAYSQVCTHLSCAVIYKEEHEELFCPCHNGVFELQAGRPTAGPPTRSLPRVLLERRGDALFATGVEVSA
jgi:nitrite reductase/ring-hydroxylating ferredoxin subunit